MVISAKGEDEDIVSFSRTMDCLRTNVQWDPYLNNHLFSAKCIPFPTFFASEATSTNYCSVSIALPADFVGPVTMSAHNGQITLPEPIEKRLATFSEVDGLRNCFVGDYKAMNYCNLRPDLRSTFQAVGVQSVTLFCQWEGYRRRKEVIRLFRS